jgi:hypothetical protein
VATESTVVTVAGVSPGTLFRLDVTAVPKALPADDFVEVAGEMYRHQQWGGWQFQNRRC